MGELTRPPELYTALTNVLIAAAACAFLLHDLHTCTLRARQWRLLAGMLFLSGLFGAVTHLFVYTPSACDTLWVFLSPVLCLTALSLARCAAVERDGTAALRRQDPLLWGFAAAAVLSAVLILCGAPFLFVPALYGGVCAFFAVRDFWICVRRQDGRCCRWYLAGLGAQAVGALGLLVRRRTLTLFGLCVDHNSIFHLFTLFMILLFWRGYAGGKKEARAV